MYRTALLFVAALIAAAGMTLGEDFWVKKDYMQWTDEEVKKVMTNSPWAKDVTVNAPPGAAGGRRSAQPSSGTDVESGGGGRGGRGRGSRGGDEGGGGPGEVLVTLNMSWRSALPLRKAIVKSRLGGSTEVPADAQQLIAKDQEDYVIVVSGIPAYMARLVQDAVNLNRSTVRIGKKAPLTPKSVNGASRTQTVELIFAFPKTDPANLDDKEVEVDLKLGQMELKRKFTLKDMLYNGKLEM